MAKPITVRLIWRGEAVETLPEEARELVRARLTAEMSRFYATHPEAREALARAPYFTPDAQGARA